MKFDKSLVRLAAVTLSIGAALTAAVLAALAFTGASLLTLLLVGGLSAGWIALLFASARLQALRVRTQWQQVDAEIAQLTSRTKLLLDHLSEEFRKQFADIRTENIQMQGILADAIERLVGSFTGLDEQARRQQTLASQLTGRGAKAASGDLSFDAFLKGIEEVLTEFVDTAERNGKTARDLVQQMTTTSSRFQNVLGMLGEVKKIADQTNLLAINAAVEAARAGNSGKGFAVVAGEVRSLSVRSNTFSNQIGESVQGITGSLSAVEGAIHEIAAQDETLVATARRRVAALLEQTRDFNGKVEQSADEISGISESVGQEVRSAVTSLQFQDMATQILQHVGARIDTLEEVLSQLAQLSLPQAGQTDQAELSCDRRLQDYKEWLERASSTIRDIRHNPVSQKSMDEGDIELF